jgi:tryptophanyl-tRNA synthetase
VGWHALTLPQNPTMLRQSKMDMLATLLAVGIDPKRAVIFHQDDVGFYFSPLSVVCFFHS